MIRGISVDIVRVERMRAGLQRLGHRFSRRVLTPQEHAICRGLRGFGDPEHRRPVIKKLLKQPRRHARYSQGTVSHNPWRSARDASDPLA